jgi:hypothetical protein
MSVIDELLSLRDNQNIIHADRVVSWARSHPDSLLYHKLEWDDGKAAHAYRLDQARRLIAIYIVDASGERKTVSLVTDRNNGGGYRDITDVMRNEEMRAIALSQALAEHRRWRDRYNHLKELARIFAAADEVESEVVPMSAQSETRPPLAARRASGR